MLELIFSCFHRFSRVQKPPKNVVIESFGGTVRKLWQNKKFGSFTSIFGYNFTQNLSNIEFSQAKRLSYLLELFLWRILAKFKEILGTDFPQSPKNCQKWPKMAKNVFFCINQRLSQKRDKISKKRPCYVSYIFYPQLRAGFRKNPRSGF